jgi:GxxExxY protein
MSVECEVTIDVWYDGVRVGHFRADMVVEQKVITENKASLTMVDADWKQLLNYLCASVYEVGLLLHFGPKVAFKRLVYSNAWKAGRIRS